MRVGWSVKHLHSYRQRECEQVPLETQVTRREEATAERAARYRSFIGIMSSPHHVDLSTYSLRHPPSHPNGLAPTALAPTGLSGAGVNSAEQSRSSRALDVGARQQTPLPVV